MRKNSTLHNTVIRNRKGEVLYDGGYHLPAVNTVSEGDRMAFVEWSTSLLDGFTAYMRSWAGLSQSFVRHRNLNAVPNTYVVSGQQAAMYAKCKSLNPVKVTTKSGLDLVVAGAGDCFYYKKRRAEISKRIQDECMHPCLVHVFGFTLTYKPEFVPWHYRQELRKEMFGFDSAIEYETVGSHTYMKMFRGAESDEIKGRDREKITLVSNRDLSLYVKRFEKWLKDTYKGLYTCKHFIMPDYGSIDNGRCCMPHYHGIWFVYTTDLCKQLSASELKSLRKEFEKQALAKWPYCEQFWDSKKKRWCGKSIERVQNDSGACWGEYLGKYLGKKQAYEITQSEGMFYVPERACASKGIGFSTFYSQSTVDWFDMLDRTWIETVRFNATYRQGSYDKALPSYYKKKILEDYFELSLSRKSKVTYWKSEDIFHYSREQLTKTEEEIVFACCKPLKPSLQKKFGPNAMELVDFDSYSTIMNCALNNRNSEEYAAMYDHFKGAFKAPYLPAYIAFVKNHPDEDIPKDLQRMQTKWQKRYQNWQKVSTRNFVLNPLSLRELFSFDHLVSYSVEHHMYVYNASVVRKQRYTRRNSLATKGVNHLASYRTLSILEESKVNTDSIENEDKYLAYEDFVHRQMLLYLHNFKSLDCDCSFCEDKFSVHGDKDSCYYVESNRQGIENLAEKIVRKAKETKYYHELHNGYIKK